MGEGIGATSGVSTDPDLTIGLDGQPIVAWEDESVGNRELYVRRFDGRAWVEVGGQSASAGGVSDNPGYSSEAEIASTVRGHLVAAWQDKAPGTWQIHVRAFDGTKWIELGAGSASGEGLSNSAEGSGYPSIDIRDGRLCVARGEEDEAARRQILLRCVDLY